MSAPPPNTPNTPGTSSRTPVVTPSRVVAGVCLVIPFVAMLWVGSYARLTPEFIGIPFFYWYQMAWVFISAGLTTIAYLLVRREERARKGAAK
ncbi:DUF3311 domain-containing protein [Streptomyces sp. H10-C2]|uniref:DUF3311 domain-containing protein n=1 Tax=unclassified Streptomyces TaxID=2593676 RepID=UPI0024BB7D91|nr:MULTISPECIES: DUF3311 domain-containing protein [unclassified Streptomyces]MDJ0343248.1 DUF3311 domain-containing protein [Streptomyces sp. PH10-H1]MDJ0370619.1 DUF3311 domain-containing protein [Streptomyces sp. H10-C2]